MLNTKQKRRYRQYIIGNCIDFWLEKISIQTISFVKNQKFLNYGGYISKFLQIRVYVAMSCEISEDNFARLCPNRSLFAR